MNAQASMKPQITMSVKEWEAEGVRRFGSDKNKWKFVCPTCEHVASVQDWKDAGAPAGTIAFSCIGRYLPSAHDAFSGKGSGPCNYAGGGLFKLNPIHVGGESYFAFAEATP